MEMEWILDQKTALIEKGVGQGWARGPRSSVDEDNDDELRFRRETVFRERPFFLGGQEDQKQIILRIPLFSERPSSWGLDS